MQRRILLNTILSRHLSLSLSQTLTLTTQSETLDPLSPLVSLLSKPSWFKDPTLPSLIKQTLTVSPSHLSSLFLCNSLSPQTSLQFFKYLSVHFPSLLSLDSHLALLKSLAKFQSFIPMHPLLISTINLKSNSKEDIITLLSFLTSVQKEFGFRPSIRCINSLLMELARFSMLDEMKSLFEKLNKGEIFGDPNLHTYNIMINAFCKIGQLTEAKIYLNYLLQSGLKPDTHTYTSFIMGYCKNEKLDNACKLFVLMPYRGCLRNKFSYAVLIHGLCEINKINEAFSVFNNMRDNGLIPDLHIYTSLIHNLCKSTRIKDAQNLFYEMSSNGLVPNIVAYNALIDGYCKIGEIELALSVFNTIENPNIRSFSELISGFCRERKLDKAMSLYSKMLESGIKPNVVTFSTLIQAQFEQNEFESAFRLLDSMQNLGLKPNDYTWSIVINALCKKDRVLEACTFFESILKKGFKGSKVIYSALIDGLCKVEKIEIAQIWLEKMILNGILPDSYIYCSILDGLCRENKLKQAIGVLNEMLQQNIKPNVVTYTILIDGLIKIKDNINAHKLFDQMLELGIKPDTCIYTVFIRSFCLEGNMNKAEKLLYNMRAKSVFPNLATYNTLIKGYENMGLVHKSFLIYRNMVNDEVKPNLETFGVLLRLLIRRKRRGDFVNKTNVDVFKIVELEDIEELIDEIGKFEIKFEISNFETLVGYLCKIDRLDLAKKLVSKLEKIEGLFASEDIYTSLIDCSCRLNNILEALEYINLMNELGYSPKLYSYKLTIFSLCENGKINEATNLFTELLSKGYNCDEIAWKIILEGLVRKNHVQIGVKYLSIMQEKDYKPSQFIYDKLLEEFRDPVSNNVGAEYT